MGFLRRFLFLGILSVALFAFAEGLFSMAIVSYNVIFRTAPLLPDRARRYVQYDEQLGWSPRPNLHIRDMW